MFLSEKVLKKTEINLISKLFFVHKNNFKYQFTLFWSTSLSTLMYLLLGSYTNITGLRIIREDVARYISRRDGYPADVDNVILINGGAIGIQFRDQYSFYWVAVYLLSQSRVSTQLYITSAKT